MMGGTNSAAYLFGNDYRDSMKIKKDFFIDIDFFPGAHRGASREFPENTIEAFERAQEIIPGSFLELSLAVHSWS